MASATFNKIYTASSRKNGVVLAAAARRFGVHKSTENWLLAKFNDTGDMRNQPLPVDITQWKNRPDYCEWPSQISQRNLAASCFAVCKCLCEWMTIGWWKRTPSSGSRGKWISWSKHQWSNAMAIKKFRFLTNHASTLMNDRINRKVTHRHALVDLRWMDEEELHEPSVRQCVHYKGG